MNTNLKSQLAAMTYLAKCKPKSFTLHTNKYKPYSGDFGYCLIEKFTLNGKKKEMVLHQIDIKITNRHFD